jgi:hypothetical protein
MACVSVFDSPVGPNGGCIFADPNVWLDVQPIERSTVGGGRTHEIPLRREKSRYRDGNIDALEETRRMRILAEDDDIVALLTAMLTKGMM